MEVGIRTEGKITIAQPMGDIDGQTAPVFQENILPLIKDGAKVLIDLTQVKFMSSAGLRVMLLTYRAASGKGVSMVLTGLNSDVRNSMSATGFLNFFKTSETLEEGLEALK